MARPVPAKLADTVSVKDYNAKGDGTTDDTTAINAAINSGAKNISFPPGSYFYANPDGGTMFSGLSNVRLFSEGGATILFKDNGNSGGVTGGVGVGWQFDSATNLSIADLSFDYATTPATRTSGVPLWVSNSSNVNLNNLKSLHSPGLSFYLQKDTNLIAHGLLAINALADGIHNEDMVNAVEEGLVVKNTGDDCLAIHNFTSAMPVNGQFSNIFTSGCGAKALSIDGGKGITVSGMRSMGSAAQGAQIYSDSYANGEPTSPTTSTS